LYIGVDLGGTTLKVALVDIDGRILTQERVPTEVRDVRRLIDQLIGTIREVQRNEEGRGHIRGVGIGLPGLINIKTNRVEVMPNLPDVSSYDLYSEVTKATGLPVIFDNDANVAAYGEFVCGAARGRRDIFYVTIGTGVGAGIILGGKIWRGSNGFAGEFGHMTIDPEGLECACGNHGCLETKASAPSIVRRTRTRLFRDSTSSLSKLGLRQGVLTSEDIADAAAEGDELAQLILERTGMFLGIALAGVINLLNVEMVVLGGGVMAAGDLILKPTVEETRKRAFGPSFRNCQFAIAALGPNAGMIGAAMLARDSV